MSMYSIKAAHHQLSPLWTHSLSCPVVPYDFPRLSASQGSSPAPSERRSGRGRGIPHAKYVHCHAQPAHAAIPNAGPLTYVRNDLGAQPGRQQLRRYPHTGHMDAHHREPPQPCLPVVSQRQLELQRRQRLGVRLPSPFVEWRNLGCSSGIGVGIGCKGRRDRQRRVRRHVRVAVAHGGGRCS